MGNRIQKKRPIPLTVFVILLVSLSAYLLGWSSLLTVKSFEVQGSMAQTEILNKLSNDAIKPSIGSKIARVETRAIKGSLEQLDWIDSVDVARKWLDRSIIIKINEKIAVAKAVGSQSSVINFDNSGDIFKPTSATQLAVQDRLPLVILQNPSKSNLTSVALLIDQIPGEMTELITNLISLAVTDTGLVQMSTKYKGKSLQIDWGLIQQIEQKCKVLNALLELPENKGIKRVNLSQPDLPIVS